MRVTISAIVIPLAAVAVSIVSLLVSHNYRRQMALKFADTRRTAYSRLWQITGLGAPTRLDACGETGHLELEERRALWASMTDWYYADGNGLLLGDVTKTVYLNVKNNLVCVDPKRLQPHGLYVELRKDLSRARLEDDRVRGIISIWQLSLLRNQMKSDLAVYGPTYSDSLREYELYFLRCSGVNLRSRAWAGASSRARAVASGSTSRSSWLRARSARVRDAVRTTSLQALRKDQGSCVSSEGTTCRWDEPEAWLDVSMEHAVPESSRNATGQ